MQRISAAALDADGATDSSLPVVEEATSWDEYCQINASWPDDKNENVIDLVSPSPLNTMFDGGGDGSNVDLPTDSNEQKLLHFSILKNGYTI